MAEPDSKLQISAETANASIREGTASGAALGGADEYAIRVKNLRKDFYISHSGVASFKSAMLKLNKMPPLECLPVLRGISFDVKKGESVAVVGRNGAGKSTLLSLLSRIYKPTEGTIEINGRVAPLLELGAGFHLDLTGYENIFVNGMILGISRAELEERVEQIVEFSELHNHIDAPVRTYSSGMNARLGFSIAVHVDADVLLLDEVLAVGDHEFRLKCGKKIDSMKEEGKTILLVSHSGGDVERLADRAIWLQNGLIEAEGNPKYVLHEYVTRSDNLLAPHAERLAAELPPAAQPRTWSKAGKEASGFSWNDDGVGFLTLASSGVTDRVNRAALRIGAWNYPANEGEAIATINCNTWGSGHAIPTGSLVFTNAEVGPQSAGGLGTDFQIGLCEIGTSTFKSRLLVRSNGDIYCNATQSPLAPNAITGFLFKPSMPGSPTGSPFKPKGNTAYVDDTANDLLWRHSQSWKPVQADTVHTSTNTSGIVNLDKPYCLFTYGQTGNIILAIPEASAWPGAWIKVKWTTFGYGNAITITPPSGFVEGVAEYRLENSSNSYPDITLQSDGENWWKVSG